MYITSREKAIIEIIIKTSGKHTALSMAAYLNVSVRTINRDLKAVEKVLETFELQLVRNSEKGFMIEGKDEQIFRLIQYLMNIDPIDQTPQEKKLQLLISIFQEEAFKIHSLSLNLGVSITTLTAYLDELSDWLLNFNVMLTKKKGVGVECIGSEAAKRNALASYILLHFNEDLLENLFLLENGHSFQDKILYYFIPDYMATIDHLINSTFNSLQPRLADSDYIALVIHMCITMQRTEENYLLDKKIDNANELTYEYNIISDISTELRTIFGVEFTQDDLYFLSVILKGSKLQETDDVPYDSIILSQKIKSLIQEVSFQLHVDLTKDFSLYKGLLAHMEPSIYRLKQKMRMFNPLKEEIKRKYPLLFMAVQNGVKKYFREIDDFPDDEIAFIVLHFGSALVIREEEISIKALVVCPTGIGTSKMLASRIRKEIDGVDLVEVKSIKEIQKETNLKSYDLIISTVKLPFINVDYILVSPLLTEKNIETIRNYLGTNIESLTKKKDYLVSTASNPFSSSTSKTITEVLKELKDVYTSIDSIFKNFRVYRGIDQEDYLLIIKDMLRKAENENLLTNVKDVMDTLQIRESRGGLGIPGTGMALYHCRHRCINELIFRIYHLDKPAMVKGMDGNNINMRNLLLILAPEELSEREQEIVSLISTSIIENQESIMIYSSSNEELIRTRLETIFLDYLHTNLLRE